MVNARVQDDLDVGFLLSLNFSWKGEYRSQLRSGSRVRSKSGNGQADEESRLKTDLWWARKGTKVTLG